MKSKSIIPSHYCSIDDIYLIEKINSATRCVKLITPSISLDMAKVLISSYDRLNAKVELITDVSEELFRFGINNLEAIRLLQNHAIDNNITSFSCKQGIRIASLIVDDEIFHFVPNAIFKSDFSQEYLNALLFSDRKNDSAHPIDLLNITDIPLIECAEIKCDTMQKEEQMAQIIELQKREIAKLKQQMEILQKTKGKFPIQHNLKYIELEVTGCRLSEQKLHIPSEFITENHSVNQRLKSKYSIFENRNSENWFNISEKVNTAINELMFNIDCLRKKYTFLLGPWKRVILEIDRKEFESECEYIRNIAKRIRQDVLAELPDIMKFQLYSLFNTLKPNVLTVYKKKHPYASEPDDTMLLQFFASFMDKEFNRVIDYFNPQINVIYKEISSEDAENPDFRSAVEYAFHEMDVSKLFSEIISSK